MFCKNCAAPLPAGAVDCPICKMADKERRVIQAKIATKKEELDGNVSSNLGPFLLLGTGILSFITINLICIGIGCIFIGIAVWWYNNRETQFRKIKNEIKELEAELE